MQAVEFFDLCFADRTTGGEVDVFERRPQCELGGFDAVASFALLAIIGLGLQQRVKELAVTGLIAGRIAQSFLEGSEHAEQFHLGHQVFGDSGTHRFSSSRVEQMTASATLGAAAVAAYRSIGFPGRRTISRSTL